MAHKLLCAAAAILFVAGCGSADLAVPDGERDLAQLALTKDAGGVNGDNDYCDGATTCDQGEGDCDTDAQCKGALVCGFRLGSQNGLDWNDDVCVPDSCTNGVQDGNETAIDFGPKCGNTCGGTNGDLDGYCIPGCPCDSGEGDCDIDADCATGLVCGFKNGSKFGLAFSRDVCVPDHCENGVLDVADGETDIDFGGDCGTECGGRNGQPYGYCYPGCECSQGEGSCGTDDDCQAGLTCTTNTGPRRGLFASVDTCEVAHCGNGVLDADETAIDYGGTDCGTECIGENGWPNGYCLPGCECDSGEGDCDIDADCATDLVCGYGNGPKHGLQWPFEACVPAHCTNGVLDVADGETTVDFGGVCGTECGGENGDPRGYCHPGCPCVAGEGACVLDDDCVDGLVCATNRGDLLGLGDNVQYYNVCWFTDRDGTGPEGDPVPANLANDGVSVAFASSVKPGGVYTIAALNDSTYGDDFAWKSKNNDDFVGIQLGTPQLIESIAFGRNNDPASCPTCLSDWQATYTLQYTVVLNPDETTADNLWNTIDTLVYTDTSFPIPTLDGWLRHGYRFQPVFATGVRIVMDDKVVIDELEVFGP